MCSRSAPDIAAVAVDQLQWELMPTWRVTMRNRSLVRGFALLATVALAPLPAAAQGKASTPSRTPDGKPNLAGIYSFSTITPLQRPETLAGKSTLTEQ